MAFRSVASNVTAASSLVVTKPAGAVQDDILIACKVIDNTGDTITWPTGFVGLTGTPITTSSVDGQQFWVAYKIAGGSEPANYTLQTANNGIGFIAAYSGRDPVSPIDRQNVNNSGSGAASPWTVSITPGSVTNTGCDLIVIWGDDVNGGVDVTHTMPSVPGTFTSRADLNGAGAANFMNCVIGDLENWGSSGAPGVIAGVGTSAGRTADWAVAFIALKPAAGGGAASSLIVPSRASMGALLQM